MRSRMHVIPSVADNLANGGTLTTPVIKTKYMEDVGLLLKVSAAGGVADVSIFYAISPDGTNFGGYDNEITASSNTEFTGLNPENWHEYVLGLIASPYIKIQVTDIAAAAFASTVDAYVYYLEVNPS